MKCQAPHRLARQHLSSMILWPNKISVFVMPCQVVLLYAIKHVLMFRVSKILMDADTVMLEMEVKILGVLLKILIITRLSSKFEMYCQFVMWIQHLICDADGEQFPYGWHRGIVLCILVHALHLFGDNSWWGLNLSDGRQQHFCGPGAGTAIVLFINKPIFGLYPY